MVTSKRLLGTLTNISSSPISETQRGIVPENKLVSIAINY